MFGKGEPAPLRVLIADDHPLVVAGVRRVLEHADGIEVVGEAQSPEAAMALIERRRPDVVLIDLLMPGVGGVEHIEAISRRWPSVKVVVLSAAEERSAVEASLNAGASAFVRKSISTAEIATVLRQVTSGAVFLAPGGSASFSPPEEPAQVADLTDRERRILAAAARGLTTAEIGRELLISDHTVKFHLTNVYRKIGVSNRAAAVRYAIEHDLTGN